MKNYQLLLITFLFPLALFGQGVATESGGTIMLFKNDGGSLDDKKRGYYIGPHVLGDTITTLMNEFEKSYVYYQKSGNAYAVEEKMYEKKYIYLPVRKVIRRYNKLLKRDKINEKEAKANLKMILEKAIKMKNYNTSPIEDELKGMKKADEIVAYFQDIKFRSAYK
jgi:hypothetical protein